MNIKTPLTLDLFYDKEVFACPCDLHSCTGWSLCPSPCSGSGVCVCVCVWGGGGRGVVLKQGVGLTREQGCNRGGAGALLWECKNFAC